MGTEPAQSPQPSGWAPPTGRPVIPGDPPRPPDPAAVRAASRRMGHFGLLVLCSLLCSSLRLPWQAAALAFSVAAIVVGVMAAVAVARARMRRASVVLTAVGVALAGLLAVTQAFALVLWPLQADLQECLDEALSPTAQRECRNDYERRVQDLSQLGSPSS